MAVKTKLKPKAGVKTKQTVSIETLAEKYIELDKEIEKLTAKVQEKVAPLSQEQAEIKKHILALANSTLPDDETKEIPVSGKLLYIGKRGTSRTISDLDKAIEFMGVDTFLKVAKINLSDVDKYLRPEEVEQVTVTQRTDTRQIKVK